LLLGIQVGCFHPTLIAYFSLIFTDLCHAMLMLWYVTGNAYIFDYSSETLSLHTTISSSGDTYGAIHKDRVALLRTSGASGSGINCRYVFTLIVHSISSIMTLHVSLLTT
jgi:hypothetical protein